MQRTRHLQSLRRCRQPGEKRIIKVVVQLRIMDAHILEHLGTVGVVDLLVHRLILNYLAVDQQGPAGALLVQHRCSIRRLDPSI